MDTREALLADTFVRLADTLVDDFDIVEMLALLSERCVDLLDAAAAGILLVDAQGNLQVLAASDERAELLEVLQLQDREGPCLDCHRTGRVVTCEDLDTEERWPRFVPVARATAFRSIHAVPLRIRGAAFGALNLFMQRSRRLSDSDVVVAQALADAATIAILQNHTARQSQRLNEQLQHALDTRIVIEQAKGFLAERATITPDAAFDRLRRHARSHNLKLSALATALVDRSLEPSALSALIRPPADPSAR